MKNRDELEDKIYACLVRQEDHKIFIDECADEAISFAIDVLKDADNGCIQELINAPREKKSNVSDAIEAWNKTAWHKIIQSKISELQSLLKQSQP